MKVTTSVLFGCYLALCGPPIAHADPVTFQFIGTVTLAQGEPGNFGAGVIEPGAPFSGSFTYDPAKAYLPQTGSDVQLVYVDDPAGTMSIRVGTLAASTNGGIGFLPNYGMVFSRGFAEPVVPFPLPLSVTLILGNEFPYAAPTPQTLSGAFDSSRARFNMSWAAEDETPEALLFGNLHALVLDDAAPVPEPATVMLVGTGVLFLAHRRRRRLGSAKS